MSRPIATTALQVATKAIADAEAWYSAEPCARVVLRALGIEPEISIETLRNAVAHGHSAGGVE